jgi:putative Mg2+ transporter-C (MgtC) family protein
MIIDYSAESLDLLGRLCLAAILGGLVGLERDVHGRAAGLRTHLLVSLGAALFTIMSTIMASSVDGASRLFDPGRIAAQIVTGIGFLGAGAIMKEGFSVRGLTTAACFWVVAAIGMASGAAQYMLAVFTCLLSLVALPVLARLDKLYKRDSYRTLTINTSLDVSVKTVIDAIKHKYVTILFVDSDRDYEKKTITISFTLRIFHKGTTDKISQELIHSVETATIPIKSISWHHGKMY